MKVKYHFGVSENFKDWLLAEIERRGWSYETLARKVGVTHSSISQWTSGKYPPKPGQLRKIAEVMGADEIELFKMVGHLSPEAGKGNGEMLPPLIRAAVREMDDMSEEGIQLVIDQMRHVLKKRYPKGQK
jgi:transcriptional regulator with XRE-family HTH domain